jgi:hypothetical protein
MRPVILSQLLRRRELAVSVAQPIPAEASQCFSSETQCTRASDQVFWWQRHLRCGSEEAPLARHTLEFVNAALLKLKP